MEWGSCSQTVSHYFPYTFYFTATTCYFISLWFNTPLLLPGFSRPSSSTTCSSGCSQKNSALFSATQHETYVSLAPMIWITHSLLFIKLSQNFDSGTSIPGHYSGLTSHGFSSGKEMELQNVSQKTTFMFGCRILPPKHTAVLFSVCRTTTDPHSWENL